MNSSQENFETVKMPQIAEDTIGVVELAPRERVPQQTADAPMPQVLEETVEAVRVVQRERMQQRTAEKIEDSPQSLEKPVGAGTLVPRERVQQRTAEQIKDAPQSPAEVVEAVTLVPHEQPQQRTFLSDQEEQLLHSLRNMGPERAMRSLEKLREKHEPPAWLWEGFAELIQRIPFE